MKYNYQNKEYEVIKMGKRWRVYSTDPTTTKEEAMEVLKSIEDLEEKSMTDKRDYKRGYKGNDERIWFDLGGIRK